MMNLQSLPQPQIFLERLGKLSPTLWQQLDQARAKHLEKKKTPAWLFADFDAFLEVIEKQQMMVMMHREITSCIPTLYAWRATKGMYVFDPTLYEAVVGSQSGEKLPVDLLKNLPEWAVYVVVPEGTEIHGHPLRGFFASLQYATSGFARTKEVQLQVGLHTSSDQVKPMTITLHDDLRECVQESIDWMRKNVDANYNPSPELVAEDKRSLGIIINLLLYLCSHEPDVSQAVKKPSAKRIRGVEKIFPADRVTPVQVGFRLGAAIKKARVERETSEGTGTGPRKAPHVRKAHFHLYWTGPGRQIPKLNWLPPIAVGLQQDPEESPVVVHPVKE